MIQTTNEPVQLDWHALPQDEIDQFDNQGYMILRKVLDRQTIDDIIEVGDRLMASDRRVNRTTSENGLYDGFRNCIAINNVFVSLLTHPKVLSAVVQLLGAHLHLMTSHLIYKSPDPPGTPDTARLPGWHRDYGNARKILGDHLPRILLKCAFYLTDLSEPNSGATLLAPGSNHDTKPIEIPGGEIDPPGASSPLCKREIACCLKTELPTPRRQLDRSYPKGRHVWLRLSMDHADGLSKPRKPPCWTGSIRLGAIWSGNPS